MIAAVAGRPPSAFVGRRMTIRRCRREKGTRQSPQKINHLSRGGGTPVLTFPPVRANGTLERARTTNCRYRARIAPSSQWRIMRSQVNFQRTASLVSLIRLKKDSRMFPLYLPCVAWWDGGNGAAGIRALPSGTLRGTAWGGRAVAPRPPQPGNIDIIRQSDDGNGKRLVHK